MKIIILGAGRVGASVAELLSSERNDITVVDVDPQALSALTDRFDLKTVVGNAIHPSVLREAGADDADLLIAAAARDETNLVACRIAKQRFNVPTRIVRLRSTELADEVELTGADGFGADYVISPEESVTRAIVKLIEYPEALQVIEFGGGLVALVAARAYEGGRLTGRTIQELRQDLPDVDVRIVAIFRDERSILPDGATRICPGDEVFCLAPTRDIRRVLIELRPRDKKVERVMIAGGGNIGLRLARILESHGKGKLQVKILDAVKRRCEYLAQELSRTLVLAGDATDEDLLGDEHVADMDLFIALTNDDEDNIMAALLAKRMGARRVIALINRRAYGELMQGGQIDVALSPAQATIGELLTYVRSGDVVAVHSLRRGAAEAIELIAHGEAKSSKVIGRRLDQIDLFVSKKAGEKLDEFSGAFVGAIVRGKGDAARVLMAHHDTVFEADDHVIVFVSNNRVIPKVEKLFQVSAGFL